MTENEPKLIELKKGDKIWIVIGICLGSVLTLISLVALTYLPNIPIAEQNKIVGLIVGFIAGYIVNVVLG